MKKEPETEPDLCCEYCEDEHRHNQPVAEVVEIGYPQTRVVQLCDECVSELQECEHTNSLHHPDAEMHELAHGTIVCEYVFENDVGCCDWNGDYHLNEDMLHLGNGEAVSPDYEDEVRTCYETGEMYHIDEMVYVDSYEEWFHHEHAPQIGDRWYKNFSKIYSQKFTYPVRNFVGIEFEAEHGDSIRPDEWTDTFIAEAKEDGSLDCDGTEYTTHPIRGDDIPNVVDEMMSRFSREGFDMSHNVGWHFHWEAQRYGAKAQKNLWNAVESFENVLRTSETESSSGFNYFRNMIRGYADYQGNHYRDWASAWAKTQVDYEYTDHFRRYERHNAQSPRAFVNFTPLRNRDGKRIEVRMYHPSSVMSHEAQGDYELLGDDYKMFIRFWDELFRKAVHRYNDLHFSPNINEFASQFTGPTRRWLRNKEKIYNKNV
jgi:hypothetical protein